MPSATEIIDELTGVHEAIRHYVMELKGSIVKLENLSAQCADPWSPSQCQIINDNQFNLKQNLQYLEKGLQDHSAKENELLKPLVGGVLMKAINRECAEINRLFEQAEVLISNISQGLPPAKDLTTNTGEARRILEIFGQSVKDHSQKMDVILQMLRSVV